MLTPSYAAHLVEWAAERDVDLRGSSVARVLVAGEPGGGEPAFRAKLEDGWGARVTEAMGIGDIGVSLWGECEEQDGMHLGARGFVHAELIDPESGAPRRAGRRRHGRARPHASPTRGGAAAAVSHTRPRRGPGDPMPVRAHGARGSAASDGTDDMLIVRGVNVFPSAVREVVSAFAPRISGHILVRPERPGVKQEPPLPVSVELARGVTVEAALADAIRERLREVLVVQARVDLVPWGTLGAASTSRSSSR